MSGWTGNRVWFTSNINVGPVTGSRIGFMRPDGLVTYAIVNERTNVFDSGVFVPAGWADAAQTIADPTNLGASSNYFTVRYLGSYCPHPTNNWWSDGPHNQPVDLGWYNAFAYGNGIESDRIRDDYNQITIANGVKASSVVATQYEEERRKTGLIHSGLYNSTSGINNLNQFLTAEKITKDMNPEYGSIQKLHTRDGDILVMHEDKIMKVMADKDALFNADGKSNVALSSNFLGSDKPFVTKYGISTNPESFAADSSGRVYFTDRARSAVLRLSGDGITNISDYGMKDWFNDHLNPHTGIAIGSYDEKKRLYNISIEGFTSPIISDIGTVDNGGDPPTSGGAGCDCVNVNAIGDEEPEFGDPYIMSGEVAPSIEGYEYFQKTLSFSEQAKGWVSFKSFFPEFGLSINNEYYTWDKGNMYQHHQNNTRNNFYGIQYKSTIDILFNDSPEVVKSFTALNYEGSLAKITPHVQPAGQYVDAGGNVVVGGAWDDGEYFNLTGKNGWYVGQSTTDLQTTGQLEFKDKEGKYFSYIKGTTTTLENLDEQEFSVQGIGVLGPTTWTDTPGPGCTDPTAINFSTLATVDDGSCEYEELLDYCLEIIPIADCILPPSGCTDPTADNYDASAVIDDGSCVYPEVIGCTDPTASNYDPDATTECTYNCQPNVVGDNCCCCYRDGCMDATVGQHPDVYGNCLDGTNITPWQALWCGGNNGYAAQNYDPLACEDEGCSYCTIGCTDPTALNYNSLATCDDGSCIYNNTQGCIDNTIGDNPDVYGDCSNGVNVGANNYLGCGPGLGYAAQNYDPLAGVSDGSCEYACNFPGADYQIANEVSTNGGTDGQFYLYFGNMNTPGIGPNSYSWQFYVFNSSGVDISPAAIDCDDCSTFGSTEMVAAMADPANQAACGDPNILCNDIYSGGFVHHFYMQGLPADTYSILLVYDDYLGLVNNGNPCQFQATVVITQPTEMPITCVQNTFPNPSIVVKNEVTDDFVNIPAVYSNNLYGVDMNYTPVHDAAALLGSTIDPNFGYGTTDLHANGFVVQTVYNDLYSVMYWNFTISCNANLTMTIPYDLARSIDYYIPDSNNQLNQVLNLDSNGAPGACFVNCCESDNYGGPLVTHTNGMFNVDTSPCPTPWFSAKYDTWALLLDALNDLMYIDNSGTPTNTPIFPMTFNYQLHDYFFVRNYITRWCGNCSFNSPGLVEAHTTKCNCDASGAYGCPPDN